MSTPTPSDFASRLTQQRQHEAEREAQIEALEKKLAKSSSDKHEKTVRTNRARFGSGKERASAASHSSRKGKAPATSSKSTENRSNGRPSKDSRSTSPTRDSRKATSTVKSENPSPSSTPEQTSDLPKKQFVRKPHLTQRLSDNEALQELRASFPQPRHNNRSKNKFKKPGTGSSSSKK